MKKVDKILDLCMRLLLFGYSATMLGITLFQIKRDKQFLLLIGAFAVLCTALYLFEGLYVAISGKKMPRLRVFLYGETADQMEAPPAMRKVIVILLLLCCIVVSIYLFGIFVTVFVTMALFPVLYDKRNILISLLIAAVVCALFYYVFVHLMGVRVAPGLLFGF